MTKFPNLTSVVEKTEGVVEAGDIIKIQDPDGWVRYLVSCNETAPLGMTIDADLFSSDENSIMAIYHKQGTST